MSSATQGYARLPFSWLEDDVMWEVLSGEAVRLMLAMTIESASALSDGWLSQRRTRHLARDNDDAIQELIEHEYLQPQAQQNRNATIPGYVLKSFAAEQKSREEREKEKAQVRARQQRSRARRTKPKEQGSAAQGQAENPPDVTSSVTRDTTRDDANTSRVSHRRSRSRSEVEVEVPPVTSSASVTTVRGSVGGASRRTDAGVHEESVQASLNSPELGHLHNSHNYSDNSASTSAHEQIDDAQHAQAEGAAGTTTAVRTRGDYPLPATPFEAAFAGDPGAELPPAGKASEVNGSGRYREPLKVSQALSLIERRISPQRFVEKSRRLVDTKGWEHVDWAALVDHERHSSLNALRAGEAEALLPQLRAWASEGAE